MKDNSHIFLLVSAIHSTKALWEVYKTEELRKHLEYLKALYDSEFDKPYEEIQLPEENCVTKIII